MPPIEKSAPKPHSVTFNVLLGATLFSFIRTFTLLSPILLSLLLVFLISLAVNPIISWMRNQTGGRKVPTGLLAVVKLRVPCLTGWAFVGPMKDSILSISETLPGYWERLQRQLADDFKTSRRGIAVCK